MLGTEVTGLQLLPNFPLPGKPLKQSYPKLSEEGHSRPGLSDDQHKQEKTFQRSEKVKNQERDRQQASGPKHWRKNIWLLTRVKLKLPRLLENRERRERKGTGPRLWNSSHCCGTRFTLRRPLRAGFDSGT